MVFGESLPTSGSHLLEIRILGTKYFFSTGTWVDLDAFMIPART
jgi:hypothetical protein